MSRPDFCYVTGKKRFDTAQDAYSGMRKGAYGQRAYRCRFCWSWHTTSKVEKVGRELRGQR